MFSEDGQNDALIQQIAEAKYMDDFWANLAKTKKVSEDVAKKTYMEENAKVSDVEFGKGIRLGKSLGGRRVPIICP